MIYIVDFGSQVTQLIARRVREAGVYCEIVGSQKLLQKIEKNTPSGIIFSGGPASVHKSKTPKINKRVFGFGIPILGICYGMQLITHQLGGKVQMSKQREFGKTAININLKSVLFEGLRKKNNQLNVWMSHGDKVIKLPKGFKRLASSVNSKYVAIENSNLNFYGLQFHPEVVHTDQGEKIINNFIFKICRSRPNWNMQNYLKNQLSSIKDQVGKDHVICGLSGGVDSMVTASIISKSINKQLTCIYVDTGLMRYNETKEVVSLFKSHFKSKLIVVDAKNKFFNALRNISDPEKKRKIIGNLFIKIFEKEARKFKNVKYLAQGTLYPDIIESRSSTGSKSSKIKSHHNVGGLPKKMNLKLIEPLKEFFKDEVRKLGNSLGLAKSICYRHPFPGPGLGIRIIGNITPQKIKILQEADYIFMNELKKNNLYNKIWQAYAALLPIKTVGVMGDARTYEYTCLLRAVTSEDGMTADYFSFPKYFLGKISNKIINNVRGINRVVYDISSKPPSTIELE